MYLGVIVESGPTQELWQRPKHPYTQALIAAVPHADGSGVMPASLPGEVPDPARPPSGCRFHPRCPISIDVCRTEVPGDRRRRPGSQRRLLARGRGHGGRHGRAADRLATATPRTSRPAPRPCIFRSRKKQVRRAGDADEAGLQVGRPLEHDARHARGDAELVDPADRAAGHLPRHPARSAAAGEQRLPALDDRRLPDRDGRAHGQPRPLRRHVRPRAHVHARLRHLHVVLRPAVRQLDARAPTARSG